MNWLDQVKAKLKAKHKLRLEFATDLDKAIRIIELYERAWSQSLELFTPNPGEELSEYGEGAKQTIEQMREHYEIALAEAEKIKKEE